MKHRLLATLRDHAAQHPQAPALQSGNQVLDYAALLREIETLAQRLREAAVETLALYADNGIGWIVADLAALAAGIRCVPLPRFFSDAQLRHALRDAGVDAVLADDDRLVALCEGPPQALAIAAQSWRLGRIAASAVSLPQATQKITYTSGSTGEPKGVCLSLDSQLAVAQSLLDASQARPDDRHLCLLPLSTLLENLAGVYAPLLAGATVVALPQAAVGLHGAAQLDVRQMLAALHDSRASTAILVPQLLTALVAVLEAGLPRPPSLRFIAVGGAPVSPQLLHRALALGLPVHEGYGLSESASVVALNRPGDNHPGSVGRLLRHLQLRIAADGEICVRGSGFLGYVGEASRGAGDWLATGDLGRLDADGRLYLDGRKKSLFITAFGRNVAPEWVERELTQHPAIAHAAVFGEGRPWNVAVLAPRALPGVDPNAAAAAAVAGANAALPDYAQIRRWLLADGFSADAGLLTANGRVRRQAVAARYGAALDSLYLETST